MKEILISSSVLILVIVLFRQLFRNKVSRRLQYSLWLLVALRLLIPIQFGQSDYSVTALTEKIENQSKPIQQVQQTLQEPVAGPSRAELYEQLLNEYLQKDDTPAEPEVQKPATPETPKPITPEIRKEIETQVEERITAPTLSEILTTIWTIGTIGMATWFIAANLLYLHRAKKDSKIREGSTPVQVRISPNVPTPCLVGLFHPIIYLTPASLQDETSLHHILTHELTHLRHGDHIWSLVRCICLCAYWFNPLVWLAAILSKRDCELACDEAALKKLGDDQRISYGKTLLATVTQSRSPAHILETATAMNETKKQLKERVNCIVKKPKTLLIAAIALISIVAVATGCAFAGSKSTEPAATEPSVTEPQSTEPTLPEPACPTDPTDPPYQMSETRAMHIAKDLISGYKRYRSMGVCCDTAYSSEDLSQFLTDAQKEHYNNEQYLLKCCHSPEEVKSHIDKTLTSSLIDGYPDDRLFADDEGNLYVIYISDKHFSPSQNVTLSQYANDRIVATVELRNADDSYYGSQIVTLINSGSGFVMENFEWFNIDIDSLPYSADTYAERRWKTMDLAMEQFGLSYIEFLYASNSIVLSATEDYAPDKAASVLWDAEAMAYRSLYLYNGTLTLNFPIRGIGNDADPLAGFFAREFVAPDGNTPGEAYRWFFEELQQKANNVSAYTGLFLDAFYGQPDLCLENMAELDDAVISNLTTRIYASLTEWDEYQQFVQFLDSLSAGTDRQAEVLELLSTPPESFTTPDDTLSIATKLIKKYRKYEILRIFCDYEYVYEDMSEYLTDAQKEEYWNNQYRITCCDTPEEIRAHIRRKLDLHLINANYPDDELFYDDEGNLYLIVLPTDYAGYSNIRILRRSDTQILAFADYGYDTYENSTAFIIELKNEEWMIKAVYPFDGSQRGKSKEDAAYRWLFDELPNPADSYGQLLLDAFFVEPDIFLDQLSAREEERIMSISDLMRGSLQEDEAAVYNKLLAALGTRIDLTDAERDALSILQQNDAAYND